MILSSMEPSKKGKNCQKKSPLRKHVTTELNRTATVQSSTETSPPFLRILELVPRVDIPDWPQSITEFHRQANRKSSQPTSPQVAVARRERNELWPCKRSRTELMNNINPFHSITDRSVGLEGQQAVRLLLSR